MENFIYSLNAALPVFLVMAAGWGLRRIGLLTEEFAAVANRFVFKVTLPLMLFHQVRSIDIYESFDAGYLAFCAGVTTCAILVIWGFAKLFVNPKESIGAFVQASYRSSAAILGMAFLQNLYGNVGMAGLMLLGSVPLYNVFAVLILTLEGPQSGKQNLKAALRGAAKGVVTNPIILGILAGLTAALLRLPIPQVINNTITSLSSLTTPLALIAIGVGFQPKACLGKIRLAGFATLTKLITLPALFLPLAAALGYKGQLFMALIIMLGSPDTPTCYVMTKNMGGDDVLASGGVMLSTLFSTISLTFWIFLWRTLGVI